MRKKGLRRCNAGWTAAREEPWRLDEAIITRTKTPEACFANTPTCFPVQREIIQVVTFQFDTWIAMNMAVCAARADACWCCAWALAASTAAIAASACRPWAPKDAAAAAATAVAVASAERANRSSA